MCSSDLLVGGFNFRLGQLFRTVYDGFALWIGLELREGWRSWFQAGEKPAAETPAARPIARPAAAH